MVDCSFISFHTTYYINKMRRQLIIRRRISNRKYGRNIRLNKPINNEDTLKRIENLPRQTTDDLFTTQFFNGIPF